MILVRAILLAIFSVVVIASPAHEISPGVETLTADGEVGNDAQSDCPAHYKRCGKR
jgi:hypothetical protein